MVNHQRICFFVCQKTSHTLVGFTPPEILVYNVLGIKNMQKKTKTICKALRETGCRRQAGKRKTCVAGHFFATERGRGTDHHHTGGVPASHQQGSDPAGLFHNQRLAKPDERRQGLFRMEQKGRPALQNPPSPRGGGAGEGRRGTCGLRHRREQV